MEAYKILMPEPGTINHFSNLPLVFYLVFSLFEPNIYTMEKIYKINPGFRIFLWVFSLFSFLLVVLIPMGVLLLYIAFRAEVRITHDMFERRWIGKKAVPWNEITEISWLPARGYLQGKMRPLRIVAKNPVSTVKFGLPVGAFEKAEEILGELQKRSGKAISK